MRRVATGIAIVFAAIGIAVLTGASDPNTNGTGKSYKIEFDNAFGLTTGGDLKVGGVRAGQTSGFDLKKIANGRYVAVVTGQIKQPGVSAFHSDASCEIRPQSLIGEYYVDCQPGSSSQMLPDGGTVPVKQTTSTIPPDLMQNVMRRPYRERFRLILAELGTGLAGRPDDLGQVLKRAHPGLRETSKVLKILGNQNKIIKDFITNSDIVVAQLEQKKKDVAAWVKEAGRTAEISATRQTALRQLQDTAPQLKRFFAELGPFSEASRPSISSLAKASKVGNKAFKDSSEEIATLNDLAVHAPSTGKNLRQFLQTLDDTNRAIVPDARAKDSAPPAPDPNAYKQGQGFTGMQALLNYFYWQTLAINPYDSLGHLLRAKLNVNSCSAYQTGPVDDSNKDLFKACNSWLGPYQPGVTAPDPTDRAVPVAANALTTKRGRNGSKAIVPGQPEATSPLPGHSNPSVPQIVIPPAVQELLDQLPKLPNSGVPQIGAPNIGPPGGLTSDSSDQKLLDFLMAP